MIDVISLDDWRRPKPDWEGKYRKAMTVQELINQLAFCDRKARVYVRNGWAVGIITLQSYPDGVYGQPTVMLYLNEDELT